MVEFGSKGSLKSDELASTAVLAKTALGAIFIGLQMTAVLAKTALGAIFLGLKGAAFRFFLHIKQR